MYTSTHMIYRGITWKEDPPYTHFREFSVWYVRSIMIISEENVSLSNHTTAFFSWAAFGGCHSSSSSNNSSQLCFSRVWQKKKCLRIYIICFFSPSASPFLNGLWDDSRFTKRHFVGHKNPQKLDDTHMIPFLFLSLNLESVFKFIQRPQNASHFSFWVTFAPQTTVEKQ